MNMNITFSIITIAKNALPELKRTYGSLKKQTIKDFEWIVVDGASTDGTKEWLNGMEVGDFRFSWMSEKDDGISDAWNKGIKKAVGKQVLILNAGDTYDEKMIEIFHDNISDNKITCSNARLISGGGDIQVGIFRAYPNKLWRGMHLPHNWCSVPKRFYLEIGQYSLIKYSMDFDWFHKYYKLYGDKGFNCINNVLGSYYLGGVSDKHYYESFLFNKKIILSSGSNIIITNIIMYYYIIKHMAKRFIINTFLRVK